MDGDLGPAEKLLGILGFAYAAFRLLSPTAAVTALLAASLGLYLFFSFLFTVSLAVAQLPRCTCSYQKHRMGFFQRLGIPGPPVPSVFFGHASQIRKEVLRSVFPFRCSVK